MRVGWFRSVNNVAHAWATQSFVDELAHQLGRDPKDFLLELIGPARIVTAPKKPPRTGGTTANRTTPIPMDTGRLRRVTELAADKAGWGKQLPPDTGSASRRIAAS